MGLPITSKRPFSSSNCHCEPFASCHSERSEESHSAQDRLSETERLIAQKVIDKAHLIRVIYIREGDEIKVITFYPTKRQRYEY